MKRYDILLVDGPYLAHRSKTAPYELTTSTGLNSKTIHNFMRSLLAVHKLFTPRVTAVCWESYGTKSWRKDLYSDYKNNRITSDSYVEEERDIQLLLHLLKIKQFYAPSNEADDVICSLVTKYISKRSTVIFTVDKDIMQVITNRIPRVHVYDGKHVLDEISVHHKFGVFPYQLCDYLSLTGDKTDNVPGVKGIGKKRAIKLLEEHNNLESIPIDKLPHKNESFSQALKAKKLITLNCSANVKTLFDSDFSSNETVESILDKYELKVMKENVDKYKLIGGKK